MLIVHGPYLQSDINNPIPFIIFIPIPSSNDISKSTYEGKAQLGGNVPQMKPSFTKDMSITCV